MTVFFYFISSFLIDVQFILEHSLKYTVFLFNGSSLSLCISDRPCSEYIRSRGEGQGGLIGRQQGSSVETLRNLQLSNAGHSRPPPACKPTVISACWTALETPLTSHNTQHVFMPRLTADARAALHILIIESDHRLQVPV